MNTSGGENQRAPPPLCANSCGFYGSIHTRNLCSKCYRNTLIMEQQQQAQQAIGDNSAKSQEIIMCRQSEDINMEKPPNDNQEFAGDAHTLQISDLVDNTKSSPPNFNYDFNNRETKTVAPYTVSPDSSIALDTATNILPSPPSADNSGDTASAAAASQLPRSSSEPAGSHDGIGDAQKSASAASCEDKPVQKNINRCFKCNKKVGLLGFQCRCDYYFCGLHRHADGHDCPFDYKTFGRQQLSKANQRVVADKLNNRI